MTATPASPGAKPAGRSALPRLLALCAREKALCAQALLCQIALLAAGLAGLGATGLGIDYLRSLIQKDGPAPRWPAGIHPPESWSPMSVILLISGAVIVSALVRAALSWLSGVLLAKLVHRRLIPGLQTAVFAKLQRLDFRFFDHNSRGSIINRATGDIQAIRNFMETVLIQALVTGLTVVVYVAYMASIHVGLTLACLATLPVMWVISVLFSRRLHPLHVKNRSLFDRMVLTLAESIEGAGVIKGFSRDREVIARFDEENDAVRRQQRRIAHGTSFFMPGMDFLMQIGVLTLLVYGGKLVIDGRLPLGAGLVVFAGLLQQFANQVGLITQIAHSIPETLTGASRVFEILDTPSGLPVPENPVLLPKGPAGVVFENVAFRHIAGGPLVLDGMNLDVKPGECVAIVGETGSGKSALLNLIPRFYDPESGRVLVGGHDARTLDPTVLRRRVGMVFQENFLFSDTVAANIAFGRPDATREEIVAAATTACAHEFIVGLPSGYDTVLGEIGVDLSGGQRQRLTIARALLGDPDILLMDDPTAAIDPETEHEILTAIERSLAGRTTFVVAHRLGTLRRADRILVLERGRIVQTGRHEELLKNDGPYRTAALHQMVDDDARQLLEEADALAAKTGSEAGLAEEISLS